MKLKYTTYRIQCTHPFGIARSSHEYYDIVFVYLIEEGIFGRGEAAPSNRYNESTGQILTQLEKKIRLPEKMIEPIEFTNQLLPQCGGIRALEAAVSTAIMDWWTQKQKLRLYEYFGADPNDMPCTSFTIAIGDLQKIPQKVAEAEPYSILKVKLGTRKDKEIISLIRQETDKVVRVDANEGWDLKTAIAMCAWLADRNVEFIEQPIKADNLSDTVRLKAKSPLPIIADENCLTAADIPKIAHAFHGINIKLMKCGSLFEAKQMIDSARAYDLKIMFGCMVESSIGITAAAHLAPLADYADLDGNLLIKNDPYSGVKVKDGRLMLARGYGLGVELINNKMDVSGENKLK